jgi:hypothetical protein
MSFDIYIGNAEVELIEGDDYDAPWLRMTVPHVKRDDAPVFENDEMTGTGNSRHPGYSQWGNFTRHVGLFDYFFNKETGLMREHPGCFPLRECDLQAFRDARKEHERKHPNATPGFDRFVQMIDPLLRSTHAEADGEIARLIWLCYWTEWALKNCERPAICNR